MGENMDSEANVSELQQRKLQRRFQRLDVNGDGYIDQQDYERISQRLGDLLGDKHPVALVRLHDAYDALWERLRAKWDADGDGRITAEEFVTAVGGSVTSRGREGYDRCVRPVVDACLEVLDDNDDGYVSRREFEVLGESTNVTADEIEETFRLMDADGDGRISAAELHEAVYQFYCDDDAQAVGNLLWGVI
jgi:Ca2+-binding EF-hand superfamily protein